MYNAVGHCPVLMIRNPFNSELSHKYNNCKASMVKEKRTLDNQCSRQHLLVQGQHQSLCSSRCTDVFCMRGKCRQESGDRLWRKTYKHDSWLLLRDHPWLSCIYHSALSLIMQHEIQRLSVLMKFHWWTSINNANIDVAILILTSMDFNFSINFLY